MSDGIAEFAPEEIKAIVFDVDDTVTRGTLGIKTQAWDTIFNDRLDRLQEARELYEYTGKGDRYNMIAHVLGEPQEGCVENPKVIEWANKFETEIQTNIRAGGIHADDLTALIAIVEKYLGNVYLLSATPQKSLEGNIEHFVTRYPELKYAFKRVMGTPFVNGKAGALADIATENGYVPEEILMVGDGGSDYKGAKGAGTQFVGIKAGDDQKWSEEQFPKVDAIAQLPELLAS
ncbi:HAD family hydrolase [Candidatus Pacebacteria bacterium]|nr:HAD family hydrolase [Candidatus Paceibacterota bacterium]